MRYQVTELCTATPGMERLRNRDEFILIAYPSGPERVADSLRQLKADLQTCDRPEGFGYQAARDAIDKWAAEGGRDMVQAALAAIDWQGLGDSDDWGEDSPIVRLFVRDLWADGSPVVFTYTESRDPRAEWYAVHACGGISRPDNPGGPRVPSGQWQFTGLANGHGRTVYTLDSLLEALRAGEEIPRGKLRVCDLDHGTRRIHGARVQYLARGPGL
jgi:hypothetical protein